MALPTLRRQIFDGRGDVAALARQLNEQLGAIVEWITRVARIQSIEPVAQAGVALTGTTKVSHKLKLPAGSTPIGWRLTDVTASAIIYRSAWDDKTITLVTSATCTVGLEVW